VLKGGKKDPSNSAICGGGSPLCLGVNEEENPCLAVKWDLQRIREKPLIENKPAWKSQMAAHH
jgi:hypothetical protein